MSNEENAGMVANGSIAFQGVHGAYSDLACRTVFPNAETLPCSTFEDTFAAVRNGNAQYAMIPIENTVAGRVADIHHLLPNAGITIVGEHYQSISHQLLAPEGTSLNDITEVYSHIHALDQCGTFIRESGLTPIVHEDTAGAAHDVAAQKKPHIAAIASRRAAEVYGLSILAEDIEDAEHNTTRFLIITRDGSWTEAHNGPAITTLVFRTRSVPAALYKAIGGFATNGINMTKLESYVDAGFEVAQFYIDVEGHPDERAMHLALEELNFYSDEVTILGVYPAHSFRFS